MSYPADILVSCSSSPPLLFVASRRAPRSRSLASDAPRASRRARALRTVSNAVRARRAGGRASTRRRARGSATACRGPLEKRTPGSRRGRRTFRVAVDARSGAAYLASTQPHRRSLCVVLRTVHLRRCQDGASFALSPRARAARSRARALARVASRVFRPRARVFFRSRGASAEDFEPSTRPAASSRRRRDRARARSRVAMSSRRV